MAGLLAKLTVTPLLWACGLLLVAVAALGVRVHMLGADVDAANGGAAAADARANQHVAERDAWKHAAQSALEATTRWETAFGTARQLLADSQREARRLDEAGRQALAAARAREAEANRALAGWMDRYAEQVRVGDCAAALNAVQQACPAFGGY
ncbi:hypothetical protein QF205_10940 [Luteimonas composti]|uniref:DUF2514 family protein n=1 Tax=Luteimonas composti TaxID=398257 RepID=A0ABT6MSK7_9GAMM|nr:hypothetical protein [Luteimonas composti]MDH7453578.1 hypothetical protein [Luteimonas composti]